VPDEAESAGGLLVAAINAAIASGAAAGGLILGHGDTRDVFTAGALVLIAATVLISLRVRPSPGDSENAEAETAIGSVVCSGTH
jgi:predicted MFS family arabinose efflux permease